MTAVNISMPSPRLFLTKRLREVLFAFHYVYKVRTNATGKMELGGAMYAGWKESLLTVERTILKELGFSFYVIEHAHRFILFFVKLLDGDAALAQEAWAYCNDALRTDLPLRSRAEVIACAAVRLAAAKLRRTLPSLEKDGVDWWAAFGVDGGELDRAAAEITSLYRDNLRFRRGAKWRPYILGLSDKMDAAIPGRQPIKGPDAIVTMWLNPTLGIGREERKNSKPQAHPTKRGKGGTTSGQHVQARCEALVKCQSDS